MSQQSPNSTDGLPFGGLFRIIVFLFCIVPSTFTRTITHRHLGERTLWQHLAGGFLLWAFAIGIWSGLVFHHWDKERILGTYFHLSSWTKLDAETGIVFLIIGVLCSGLQLLDLWRRDITHGTYLLSTMFGEPRLPVGNYEMFCYWLIPSATAFLFHLYGSAILFFVVFIMNLFTQIYMEGVWRFELLSKRDGHLLQESIDQNEVNVIGLRAALNGAGKPTQSVSDHSAQNSNLH